MGSPQLRGAGQRKRRAAEIYVVSSYKPSAQPGMPGHYPGQVVAVHAEKCIETAADKVDMPTVREMMAQGMRTLTGDSDVRDSWARFFTPVRCRRHQAELLGRAQHLSSPEIVGEIVRNLIALGIKPDAHLPLRALSRPGGERSLRALRPRRRAYRGDRNGAHARSPTTTRRPTSKCDFFGEDDTRSNMIRLVTETFTKIVNVPNMKDHGAAGVTGCLKNIAYGDFSNVARSHHATKTNTLSFIGTLAMVEPLRSQHRAADHGRPARRLAGRSLPASTRDSGSIPSR